MQIRSLLLAALLASVLAPDAVAAVRTASITVSVTVIASCRIELPTHVDARARIAPAARLTCPRAARPATRAVISADGVRYDVEY